MSEAEKRATRPEDSCCRSETSRVSRAGAARRLSVPLVLWSEDGLCDLWCMGIESETVQ